MSTQFVALDSLTSVVSTLTSTLAATGKMTKKLAEQIVGSLSDPSKMPGKAYGFAAKHCITGSKLAKVPGSVCFNCYALKGFYAMPSYQDCDSKRFDTWTHPRWVEAMVFLITKAGDLFFRWHDSGDLQDVFHLSQIVAVCLALPNVKFWLPTREYKIVLDFIRQGGTVPANLVIRLSAHMVDSPAPSGYGLPTSTVHTSEHNEPAGHICRAYQTSKLGADGKPLLNRKGEPLTGYCGDCRACWNPEVANVSYLEH